MGQVVLYGTRICPYCVAARHLLRRKAIDFQDISVEGDAALRQLIAERSGRTSVPQIWIGEHHVGGFTDLLALERSGRLNQLLVAVDAASGETPGTGQVNREESTS